MAVAAAVVLGLIVSGLTAQCGKPTTNAPDRNDPVQPTPGYYQGVDNQHRQVTFKFDGEEIHHFHAAHLSLGGAHVNRKESAGTAPATSPRA